MMSEQSKRWNLPLAWIVASACLCSCAECDSRPRAVPITVGRTVNGQLERSDWTDVFADGSYSDLYEIDLEEGQQIRVELSSDAFDTYLSVMRGPGDQIVDNDDISSEDTNSRLVYRSPIQQQCFIAVTTFRTGETGPYRLVVSESTEQLDEQGEGASPQKSR